MQFDAFSIPALFLLGATSLILLLGLNWRVTITALGAQYLGVFILVGLTWPFEMAAIKLVTGWIAAAVLGLELVNSPTDSLVEDQINISGGLFRIILAVLVGLAILSFAPTMAKWLLQASYQQIFGGLLLVGMGLLNLGVSDHPFRVAGGILTLFSGFEILYATIETSSLVGGFLAVFSLGLALIFSYLIAAPGLEGEK